MTIREADISVARSQTAQASEASARRRRGRKRRQSVLWRVREDIPRRLEITLLILSLLAPLAIWAAIEASGIVNPIFLPSIGETATAAREMLDSGVLLSDTQASVQRVGIGFAISLLIAIPLGLAMGTFKSMQSLFEPAIGLIRYAPATAFTPLLLIWLGIGEDPKVTLVVIGTVFFNTLMIANVVWQVPSELIKVSFTLGAGSGSVFRKVIFPHAVLGIIDTARVNLAAAWNLIIVAELLAANEGLGVRIIRAQKFLNVDQIFVAILAIGIIGLTTDIALRTLRNRVAPWSQE